MLELRKTIQATLKKVADRVYYLKANSSATYPYIVYSLEVYPQVGEDELQLVTLQIDGWDNVADTSQIELLMKNVEDELKDNLIQNEKLSIRFKLDSKVPLFDDDNPSLSRRTFLYSGRLYERNDN